MQLATGAGKSLVIAGICHKINKPVLILQPSKEILEQNVAKLQKYGINDIGVYSASMNTKDITKYTFATIGSIYKKPEKFKHFGYVIIDECHQVNAKDSSTMLLSFLNAINANVIGLTATPYRIVQKYYRENGILYYTAHLKMLNRTYPTFFKSIIYKIETNKLIDDGYLSPIRYYASDTPPPNELIVNSTGANYTEDSMTKFTNKRLHRICDAIRYADKHHNRSLTFCTSLHQANKVLATLQRDKVGVMLVDGSTPKNERETSILAFKNGQTRHLINVGVFTTGFDVPQLDCIIMARPTMSLGLWYQMVGRGVRLDPDNPKKILHVYDLSGNTKKLGRVENITVKTEAGGFRDEVWGDRGRMDDQPLFKWEIKK